MRGVSEKLHLKDGWNSQIAGNVQVGFVGCGGIAVAHLKGLVRNPDVKLHAFCDINLDRAKEVAGQYGTQDAKVFDEAFCLSLVIRI